MDAEFKNKKIVIAGGTGFLGREMATRWAYDNEVIILSRGSSRRNKNTYSSNPIHPNAIIAGWDAKSIGKWTKHLEGADILINLAGKSVNCRYTQRNKDEIMNSRVAATKVLGAAISELKNPPKLWINSASATIYRHAEDRPQDEYNGDIEDDFSVQVCKAWEQTFNECEVSSTRKVALRMAIVLGEDGVLVPLKNMVKIGFGGMHGNGKQMFSWVHIDDVCRSVEWIYNNEGIRGVYNLSAPNPIRNGVFMKTLRKQMKIPFGIPVHFCMLRLGAWLIGTEQELLLKSRWVVPTKLQQAGYQFKYANIDEAVKSLLKT